MRPRLRLIASVTCAFLSLGRGLHAQEELHAEGSLDEDDSGGGDSFGDVSDLGGTAPAPQQAPAADVTRPPPPNRGVIVGSLVDRSTRQPIIDAKVSVTGRPYSTLTDLDGRFRLELPPGTYELRYFEGTHQPARTTGLVVSAGETVAVDTVRLEPFGDQAVEQEIVGVLEKRRVEGQILARQRAASVGDIIGRGEISKTADSNAAEAARRVVGATIVGGRFVYVRGLGERYSNALLDGSPLPSPEPDRAAVPLDLFPVEVLDSITIVKTFTPDLPGDFAGGSVQVETRTIPDELVFSASAGAGFNTEATFRDRVAQRGSNTDWLGFDSGLRQLPDGITEDYALARGVARPNGTLLTQEDLQSYGARLNSSMRWRTDPFTPPNHSGSLVLGNGWKLPNGGRLGAVGSFGYGRSYERRAGVAREFIHAASDPRGFEEEIDYRVNEGEESVRWGAFGSIAYAPSDHDEIRLVGFRSQLANDLTRIFAGHSRELDSQVSGLRLQYVSRALSVGKLTGTHTFSALNGAVLDWSGLLSLAQRDEPDTRDAAFTPGSSFDYQLNVDSDSGRHFFSDLSERGFGGTLDLTQPLDAAKKTKLKVGGLGSVRRREFQGRRFNFYPRPGQFFGCDGASFRPNCPDRTFSPSALSEGNLFFEERTLKSDGYTADLDVFAGYVMTDLEVVRELRVILGERVEATHQTIEPNEFGTGEADGARLNSVDLLPSASVVYAVSEQVKARAGASRTLARPQLRELAPFAFNEYYLGRVTTGNPDLKLTRITNLDLRLEYFPTLREVAAVSVFYKQFTDPIEPTLKPGGGGGLQVSYVNTPGANLVGVELETRKGLGFISPALEDLSTVANLTLARSRIEVEQTGTNTITSLERPLVYQSPWVVNLALDYDNEGTGTRARISYNVNGPHIVEAGAYQVPDSYRQPQHYVDITASQTIAKGLDVKAGVEDILNSKTLVTQGKRAERDNVRTEFRDGAVIFVGASYTY